MVKPIKFIWRACGFESLSWSFSSFLPFAIIQKLSRPRNPFMEMNTLLMSANVASNSLAFSSGHLTKFCSGPAYSHAFSSRDRDFLCLKEAGRFCGVSKKHGKSKGVRAALSDLSTESKYSKIAALSTGTLSSTELLNGVEAAAKRGAEVVMEAVYKPRNIDYKGKTDLVTDTDRRTELAILKIVREKFKDHLILGEEGGFTGDPLSEYLWCIDPLDGTTNFAHGYPSFAVSVGVLYRGKPAASCVVEFAGGPFCWVTRTFSATAGGGAFCNGQQIHVSITDQVERSLFVTGFGYDHDESWATNIDLFKEFTDVSRGVRRLGAAAVDMCHVALGIVEAFWEYRLKPWDMAAGALIVEEAGGTVTCMDGSGFCVFDRSILVSNGVLHGKLLERIAPPTRKLIQNGMDVSHWFKPGGYKSDV